MSFSITGWWAKEFISAALTVTPEFITALYSADSRLVVDPEILTAISLARFGSAQMSAAIDADAALVYLRMVEGGTDVTPTFQSTPLRIRHGSPGAVIHPSTSVGANLTQLIHAQLLVIPSLLTELTDEVAAVLSVAGEFSSVASLGSSFSSSSLVDPSSQGSVRFNQQGAPAALVIPASSGSAVLVRQISGSLTVEPAFELLLGNEFAAALIESPLLSVGGSRGQYLVNLSTVTPMTAAEVGRIRYLIPDVVSPVPAVDASADRTAFGTASVDVPVTLSLGALRSAFAGVNLESIPALDASGLRSTFTTSELSSSPVVNVSAKRATFAAADLSNVVSTLSDATRSTFGESQLTVSPSVDPGALRSTFGSAFQVASPSLDGLLTRGRSSTVSSTLKPSASVSGLVTRYGNASLTITPTRVAGLHGPIKHVDGTLISTPSIEILGSVVPGGPKFDASSNGAGDSEQYAQLSTSWTHTATAGATVVVAAGTVVHQSAPTQSISVTYGGISPSYEFNGTFPGGDSRGEIFVFENVSGGPQTVALTCGTVLGSGRSLFGTSVSYTNVTSIGTLQDNYGKVSNMSLSISDVPSGGISSQMFLSDTPISGYSQTERASISDTSNGYCLIQGDSSSEGSAQFTATTTAGQYWSALGVVLS